MTVSCVFIWAENRKINVKESENLSIRFNLILHYLKLCVHGESHLKCSTLMNSIHEKCHRMLAMLHTNTHAFPLIYSTGRGESERENFANFMNHLKSPCNYIPHSPSKPDTRPHHTKTKVAIRLRVENAEKKRRNERKKSCWAILNPW